MRLSVLDQSPIPSGSSGGDALRNSIDLARRCEAFGFHRYWVAEHHNTGGLAGSAPEILIAHIAEATERIRVGSGGVMMPHYAPYKVAGSWPPSSPAGSTSASAAPRAPTRRPWWPSPPTTSRSPSRSTPP